MQFWSTASSGLIAGLIAGLLLGLLTITFIAPVVISAEKFEAHSEDHASVPHDQRNVFTVIGTIVIGTVYGLILSTVYNLTDKQLMRPFALRGMGFGVLAYIIITFIPSLAFPPNPPGVEAQASVAIRQGWWLGIVALEIVGLFAYIFAFRHFGADSEVRGHVVGLATFGAIVSIPFLIGPANKLEEVLVPAQLLLDFRLISLSVLLIFWLTLGLLVGWISGWLRREGRAA